MQRCSELELKLLQFKYTGLQKDEIKAHYVEISPYCKLRTIEVGFNNRVTSDIDSISDKPKLVFIHGYGASGATFWRIMKPLSEYFHVIFVDLPGMGSSTRVPFFCKSADQASQFFT